MMSGPLPAETAAVMRGCRSLALMRSRVIWAPSALLASVTILASASSAAGTKSFQRRMCSLVPWANAGARRAPRMPSSPAAAPASPAPLTNVRRFTAPGPAASCCFSVSMSESSLT